ncbi:MAG: prolyl oligopeptidase family serine peptidase [Thermoleophilia bacterium]
MTTAPYGSWRSPITARSLAHGGLALGGLQAAGEHLYWLEMRPAEEGRSAIVERTPSGSIRDVTPADGNARTLVHEYGGGSYVAFSRHTGRAVVASDFADQRLYLQDIDDDVPSRTRRPLTRLPEVPRALRYADGRVTPDGRRLIVVRERHQFGQVVNELVALSTAANDREPVVIASGHDFYAAPRISPDGRALAWLSWDHPQMPWDGTRLWVAELFADALGTPQFVAGGTTESIVQPSWSADGSLHYISDRSGWWNVYRCCDLDTLLGESATNPAPAMPLVHLAADFAKPPWVFGLQSYAFLREGRIACIYSSEGIDHIGLITPGAPGIQDLPCEFTTFSSLVVAGDSVAVIGGNARKSSTVALIDIDSGDVTPLRESRALAVDPSYLSRPESITFPTSYPDVSVTGPLVQEMQAVPELHAHALYYAPTNPDFVATEYELPPLIVLCHGGPTSARETILSLDVQYWTSRGYAVVDVNYGGSTGYGRAYRERLRGNWGVVDTLDCINAARYLVARGAADPQRLAIEGGSAGGYTTLNALARHSFFAAGASYFGLADLELFASGGTHKFESRYLDGLVGPYPEAADVLHERSPLHHVDDISCPVIVLQGLEDAIVPPAQAELIVTALRRKGLPYAYVAFADEQHGFRKAENIVTAQEAVLTFFSRVFDVEAADGLPPLAIENFDRDTP